jgi:hypothetical protein
MRRENMADKNIKVEGIITRIEGPITSKGRNNAQFYAVEIESSKFYDWKHVAKDFREGQYVQATVTEGEYPRILNMVQIDAPARSVQHSLGQDAPRIARGFSPPIDGMDGDTFALLSLAVELVKEEQLQIDEKINRAKTAFFAFKDLLRIERMKVRVGEGPVVEKKADVATVQKDVQPEPEKMKAGEFPAD